MENYIYLSFKMANNQSLGIKISIIEGIILQNLII